LNHKYSRGSSNCREFLIKREETVQRHKTKGKSACTPVQNLEKERRGLERERESVVMNHQLVIMNLRSDTIYINQTANEPAKK